MHILFSILLFVIFSFAAFSEQGTMSTDDTREAKAAASLSGTTDDQRIESQEEEVRIEDDEYDPDATEINEEKMEEYRQKQDVQY